MRCALLLSVAIWLNSVSVVDSSCALPAVLCKLDAVYALQRCNIQRRTCAWRGGLSSYKLLATAAR
jgi:hypothetical protein